MHATLVGWDNAVVSIFVLDCRKVLAAESATDSEEQ